MKSYNYSGKSNLIFSHEKKDYLVHGTGPHDLPEEAQIVKTHVRKGTLVETIAASAINLKNSDKTNNPDK